MSYLPIEHYGMIGDLRSVALVGKNGSIDWLCLPNFDSPSVFAAILDDEKGGSFSLAAEGDPAVKQMYLPNTNVLITRFLHDAGMGEVSDFMSVGREAGGETEQSSLQLVRIAKSIRAHSFSDGVQSGVRLTPGSRTKSRWAPTDVARSFMCRTNSSFSKVLIRCAANRTR